MSHLDDSDPDDSHFDDSRHDDHPRDEDAMNAFDSAPFKPEWTREGHATEESVYAWLDGALDAPDSDVLEQHIHACTTCSAAVAEARGYIAASMRIMHAADLSPRQTSRNVVSPELVARAAAAIVARANAPHFTPNDESNSASHYAAHNARSGPRTLDKAVRAQPAVRRWLEPTLVRAAAAVLLMVGGAYVLTRTNQSSHSENVAKVATSSPPSADSNASRMRDSVPTVKLPAPISAVASAASSNREIPEQKTERSAASRDARRERTSDVNVASVASSGSGANAENTRRRAAGAVATPTPTTTAPQVLPGVVVQATPEPLQTTKLAFSTSRVTVAMPDTFSRRTITGKVLDGATASPLSAASVLVPGTTLAVMSDAEGNFTLQNVPAGAKSLSVRRIGYAAADVSLESMRGATGSVEARLRARPAMLNEVAVTSINEPPAPNAACFVMVTAPAANFTPLVQSVRVRREESGLYSATIVGWPKPKAETRVTLVVNAQGALMGTVRLDDARLELELIAQGEDWFSTLQEFRGINVRSENIKFVTDKTQTRCR